MRIADYIKKHKWIFIVLLLALIAIVTVLIINGKKEELNDNDKGVVYVVDRNNKENVKIKNNIKYNISKEINKDHYLVNPADNGKNKKLILKDVLIIGDMNRDMCHFSGVLYNETTVTIDKLFMSANFYDKEENYITNFERICDNLESGGKCDIDFDIGRDISNAYSMEVIYSVME